MGTDAVRRPGKQIFRHSIASILESENTVGNQQTPPQGENPSSITPPIPPSAHQPTKTTATTKEEPIVLSPAVTSAVTDTPEDAASRVFPDTPSTADTPVKRKRGRPPNPEKANTPHLPKPPAFKCKPDAFLQYWKKTDTTHPNRLSVYVYRKYPVIDRDRMGLKRNIDIIPSPIEEDIEGEMLHRHGSGDYKLILNDSLASKQVCQTSITVRDQDYPPLVTPEELIWDDPANRSYVEILHTRGVYGPNELPEKRRMEDEESMAETTALAQVATDAIKMTMDTMKARAEAPPAAVAVRPSPSVEQDATNKGMQIIATAAGTAQSLIEKAVVSAQELTTKNGDTSSTIREIAEVVTLLRPADPMANPAVQSLMSEIKDLRSQALESQRAEMAELRKALAETRAQLLTSTQPGGVAPASATTQNQVTTIQERPKDDLDRLIDLQEKIGRLRKLGGSITGEDEGEEAVSRKSAGGDGDSIWMKLLPMALPALSAVLGLLTNAAHNWAVGKTGQGQVIPPPQMPQMPMQMPGQGQAPMQITEEQYAQMVATGQIQPGDYQPQPTTTSTGAADMNINPYKAFLAELEQPLILSLSMGETGDVFAGKLIDWKGRMAYDILKSQGKDVLVALLRSYPPIWDKVSQIQPTLSQFLDDFLNYDAISASEEGASGAGDETLYASEPIMVKRVKVGNSSSQSSSTSGNSMPNPVPTPTVVK